MSSNKLKFLVVNNHSIFASKDVWDGLIGALRMDLGYEVLPFSVDQLQAFISKNMMEHYIVSTAVSTRNNFTHVIFIGSTFLPEWVMSSINRSGVKTIYWSMEDPHALDQNINFKDRCSYYFTNDKAVAREIKKAFYLPTAGSHSVCMPSPIKIDEYDPADRAILDNDVVFCGNIYPNRRKILEPLIPIFEKNKIRFGIMGITALMKDDENKSPLRNYIKGNFDGVVDHKWFVAAYGLSKFVINIERDPTFEYDERFATNREHKIIGESLNPRAYEVALCGGGLQLIDKQRKEIFEPGILEPDKHCIIYDSPEDMAEKIIYYMNHEDERKAIVDAARKHALANHTYVSRAMRMIRILNWKEGRNEDLSNDIMKEVFTKKNIKTKTPGKA